jgi:hypothetical protein
VQSDAKTALGFASIWYSAENQRMKDLEFFNRIDPQQTFGDARKNSISRGAARRKKIFGFFRSLSN